MLVFDDQSFYEFVLKSKIKNLTLVSSSDNFLIRIHVTSFNIDYVILLNKGLN
jgi:hypothetical protein